MTCVNVQAVIEFQGVAIMRYRSSDGATLYDCFLKDRSYCQPSETTAATGVPTAD